MDDFIQRNETTKKKPSKRMAVITIALVLALIAISLTAGLVVTKILPEKRLKSLLSLGDKYLSEIKYDDAIAAYEEALMIEPRSEEAYLGIANAYIGLKDYEKALEAVERGVSALGETEALLKIRSIIEELIEQQRKEEVKAKTAYKKKYTVKNLPEDLYFHITDKINHPAGYSGYSKPFVEIKCEVKNMTGKRVREIHGILDMQDESGNSIKKIKYDLTGQTVGGGVTGIYENIGFEIDELSEEDKKIWSAEYDELWFIYDVSRVVSN